MLKYVVVCWIVAAIAIGDSLWTMKKTMAGKCPLRWVDVGMVFNGGVALGCALVFTAIYMRIGD